MEEMYDRYSGMVKAYLTRLSGSSELAEELTQETFYQAVRRIDRFDGRCSASTWLCGIAKHLYIDAVRRRKPVEPLPEDIPSGEDFAEKIPGWIVTATQKQAKQLIEAGLATKEDFAEKKAYLPQSATAPYGYTAFPAVGPNGAEITAGTTIVIR